MIKNTAIMKISLILALFMSFLFASCDKDESLAEKDQTASESFLPLSIGNYWRVNQENNTEVRDTVRIKGDLYYKVFSLIGGDAFGEDYLRIDANGDLISSSPRFPDSKYLKAKFNASIGESFQTLGDKSYNDYMVTVTEKSEARMTFSYDMIYHPNLKGHPHTVTYVKGLGWESNWKTARIDGREYSR